MIEYIIANNPDDRILEKASKLLKNNQIICLPTDTNWILLASAASKLGIEKLYKVKKENKDKHFSVLCSDISQASEIANIENSAFRVLKKIIPGHYTFIFEATKKMAKTLQASKIDKEVGIRFVPSHFVTKLIEVHDEALISTNIPSSLLTEGEEIYSYMLEDLLQGIVSMIIDPGEFEFTGPSTIVDFSKEVAEVVRVGAGDPTPF